MSKFNGRRRYRHKHKYQKARPVVERPPMDPDTLRGYLQAVCWMLIILVFAAAYYA